jgi:cytochrome c oxidase assembly protein subunit 11
LINRVTRTALLAGMLGAGMTGLGYASAPLYRMFCEATGFNGTTQRGSATDVPGAVAGKTMSIRFDANHVSALPWEFSPESPKEEITIGARDMAFFHAKNLSDKAVTGQARFNVTPTQAGKYFTKIQCFCFTEQTLLCRSEDHDRRDDQGYSGNHAQLHLLPGGRTGQGKLSGTTRPEESNDHVRRKNP